MELSSSFEKETSYTAHPVEEMEPNVITNDYREIAKRHLFIINRALNYILTYKGPQSIASWHVAYAMGLACCEGRSMNDTASAMGVSRAHISNGAKEVCRILELPPSFYMKKEESSKNYRASRNSQLKDQ